MSDYIIKVENLGKKYRIRHQQRERYVALRDVLAEGVKSIGSSVWSAGSKLASGLFSSVSGNGPNPHHLKPNTQNPTVGPLTSDLRPPSSEDFWALRDVSFEVKQGEVVGIIGRNGAGKTTLLKILSRITEPTEGRVRIRGRVASLLEVGTGFHPELTGRENIYLNGGILGMTRADIKRKFDEIVAFAEVEKFLDTPVKRYSSGMSVRLAFAVAAHLEPEILLVDEVLAVGDAAFQKKCLGKMGHVAKEGRTVLFVSHNMGAIGTLCSRVIWVELGRIVNEGESDKVVESYISSSLSTANTSLRDRKARSGSGKVRITDVYLVNREGGRLHEVMSGQKVGFVIDYKLNDEHLFEMRNPRFKITAYNYFGQPLLHFDNEVSGFPFSSLPLNCSVKCWIERFPLSPGLYRANVSINRLGEVLDHLSDALAFHVVEGDFYATGRNVEGLSGICLTDHTWSCDDR